MYKVLDKDILENEILLPHLSIAKRSFETKRCLVEVINCILYKLKTGIQWYMLPLESLFSDVLLSYKAVYWHFSKWSKNGDWEGSWVHILESHKSVLDLSTSSIDELPTMYFRGLDNLIATARSNKVAVCLGFQDFSQLNRDYGDKESKVVQNTVGEYFSGQVVGESAKTLSDRFGKVLQKRQSMTINRQDKSTSISTQMDSLIPASKISNLTQGMFVGAVSDNFDEKIEQKIFHAEIVIDNTKVAAETKAYQKIPILTDFITNDGIDLMEQKIQENYNQIKLDVKLIVEEELERIKSDPKLAKLLLQK